MFFDRQSRESLEFVLPDIEETLEDAGDRPSGAREKDETPEKRATNEAIERWMDALAEGGNPKTNQLLQEAVEAVYTFMFPDGEFVLNQAEKSKLLQAVASATRQQFSKMENPQPYEMRAFIGHRILQGVENVDKAPLRNRKVGGI